PGARAHHRSAPDLARTHPHDTARSRARAGRHLPRGAVHPHAVRRALLMNLAEYGSAPGRGRQSRARLRVSRIAARSVVAERASRRGWAALAPPPLGELARPSELRRRGEPSVRLRLPAPARRATAF